MDKRTQALYLLAAARNFSPAHHDLLVSQLGSLDALLDCSADSLRALELPGGHKTRLAEALTGCDPLKELEQLAARGISAVGWKSAEFPELLSACDDAPLMLFCRGDIRQMRHHGIAIVGSRKCTERGKELSGRFARELAELAIPVVSGMALGIDAAAHEGALEVRGPTVAVLGCGVDVLYPPQHHELYERLCADALVVSEYPCGTPPLAEHFPQRNRIISGLSRGTLVIEAPMGSGALITAKLANAQGRDVFALPGPLASPMSKGCHHLIKTGQAKLVENVDDILSEFGTNRAALRAERFGTPRLPLDDAAIAGSPSSRATGGDAVAEPGQSVPQPERRGLTITDEERRLLDALSYEGTHVNALVRKLGLTTAECIAQLTMLEIKGLISSASGGYYVRL